MRCKNRFCVYWREDVCILEEIELDLQGSCQSCIYVSLPAAQLQRARAASLRALNASDANESRAPWARGSS